jgi:excisionase family DNA binding protein
VENAGDDMKELPEKEFYSPEEIGQMLGLSDETIRGYIRSKELQAYRFGKSWRVHKKDFEKFLEAHKNKDE